MSHSAASSAKGHLGAAWSSHGPSSFGLGEAKPNWRQQFAMVRRCGQTVRALARPALVHGASSAQSVPTHPLAQFAAFPTWSCTTTNWIL